MNFKKLKNKFESDLKKLQESCKHKKTEILEEYWAPGHSTGKVVRVCVRCEKLIDKNFY